MSGLRAARRITEGKLAEANGSRTHHRYRKIAIAGFEDRDDHRTACASVAQAILLETKKARAETRANPEIRQL
jgi:hypothetical protein